MATAPAEEWRAIPGAAGLYSVSSLGRVRSEAVQTSRVGRRRGRVLTCLPDTKGYLQFGLALPGYGRSRTMKVHRAVALAFLGPRPAGAQINHRSGDKSDNSVTNLEYITCRENIRHGWALGLYTSEHARGERNQMSKLRAADIQLIRASYPQRTLAELAQEFGVTKANISQIVRRKTWRRSCKLWAGPS
jgi:hypothetical protein